MTPGVIGLHLKSCQDTPCEEHIMVYVFSLHTRMPIICSLRGTASIVILSEFCKCHITILQF